MNTKKNQTNQQNYRNQSMDFDFNLHCLIDFPKLREFKDWSKSALSVEIFKNMSDMLSPSRYFWSTLVNLLDRNEGSSPFFIAFITLFNSVSDLLIYLASWNRAPVTPESFCLSLPARSTKTKLLILIWSTPTFLSRN